jgi:hypothetical protein
MGQTRVQVHSMYTGEKSLLEKPAPRGRTAATREMAENRARSRF